MSNPYLLKNKPLEPIPTRPDGKLDFTSNKLDVQTNCSSCRAARYCLPGLCFHNGNTSYLSEIKERHRIFRPQEYVIYKGEPQRYLYAVHSGCCKSYFVDDKGREHVSNFYYPGDIIGFESMFSKNYLVNIVTMDTSDICYINLAKFKALLIKIPQIQEQLLNVFGQQLWQSYTMKGSFKAKELVVQFLLNISSHVKRHGQSAHEFNLPMGRQDIANFLGLSSETVSRVLTELKKKNLINVDRNHIKLLELSKLHNLTARSLE
jgi:CRP/FNR family transcriptional regulator, anaerobic regulatory protein